MEYQTLMLSEQGLRRILANKYDLPTEDLAEVRRALQVISDERYLKQNEVKVLSISKGFYAGKYIV
jgi:hypothetical protein